MIVIWILFYLSFLWTTKYIWFPVPRNTLPSEATLFHLPIYNGFLTQESMIFCRRNEVKFCDKTCKCIGEEDDRSWKRSYYYTVGNVFDPKSFFEADNLPRIYICVTMWHETQVMLIEFEAGITVMDKGIE